MADKTPNALFISYAYPPISAPGALRISRFAKYLPENHWSPTVLTVSDGYSRMKQDGSDVEIPGVDVRRAADKPYKARLGKAASTQGKDKPAGIKGKIKNFAQLLLMIPDRDCSWIPSARTAAFEIAREKNIGVVISSSPTVSNHLVARALSRKLNVPWIADFRDPWTIGPAYSAPGWRASIDRRIEASIIAEASKVLVVSEFIKSLFDQAYPAHAHKVSVIYNGFDEDDFDSLDVEPIRDRFVLSYAGSFYAGRRDPSGLLQAVARLKESGVLNSGNFLLRLIGHPEEFVNDEIARLKLEDVVELPGMLAYQECLIKLAESSATLLVTFSDPLSKGEMTTKFFEYLALKKPMLGIIPEGFELAEMMRRYNAGSAYAPDDVAGMAGWLEQAIKTHIEHGPQVAEGGDITKLSRRTGTAQLADLMNEITR